MSHTETKEVPIFQLFLEGIAIVRRDLMEPGRISLFFSRTIALPNHSLELLLAQQGYTQGFWGDAVIDRSTIHSSFPPNYLYLQHFSRLHLLLPQSLSYPYSCNNFVLVPNVWECIMDFAFFFSRSITRNHLVDTIWNPCSSPVPMNTSKSGHTQVDSRGFRSKVVCMRSLSVSRSYLVIEDEGVREEKTRSNNTCLCISHLGATLHSGLRACMAYGIWHM